MKKKLKNPNTPKLWDELLFENNSKLRRSPFYLAKMDKVLEYLGKYRGKFLDIGFGRGDLEKKIIKKRLPIEIYGVDISSRSVKIAKKGLKGNYYVSDIYKLPFKSSFFEIIAILDVLEHIYEKDIFRALREVSRVLKKNGKLVISIPLNENLDQLNMEGRNSNRHLREYTPEILQRELSTSGFKIIAERYIYAFKELYTIKSFIMKFLAGFRKPNLLIVYCVKK